MLGSASDLSLRLSNLQQLSLRGFIPQFLEQSVGALCEDLSLTLASANMIPRRRSFLTTHGLNLVVLDLNLNVYPPVDVATILDICPAFTTFTFNADWGINPTGIVSNITKRPHLHISTIDLHRLSYTFGTPFGIPMGAVAGEDWSPQIADTTISIWRHSIKPTSRSCGG